MKKTYTGQSLAEYSIAAGLVVLLTIGGLTAISNNFVDLFQGVNEFMLTGGGPLSTSGAAGINTHANAMGYATVTVPLANGSSVSIENYPLNSVAIIETGGASGYTGKVIASLRSLASQLHTAGEIDDTQLGLLQSLANAGHGLGKGQKRVETFLKNNPGLSWSELSQIPHYVHSSSDTIQRVINEYDTQYPVSQIETLLAQDKLDTITPHNYQVGSAKLMSRYRQAKNSGALNNPAVKKLVNQMTADILTNGEVMIGSIKKIGSDIDPNDPQAMNTFLANKHSKLTDKRSASICATGGGKSTNATCSPT